MAASIGIAEPTPTDQALNHIVRRDADLGDRADGTLHRRAPISEVVGDVKCQLDFPTGDN